MASSAIRSGIPGWGVSGSVTTTEDFLSFDFNPLPTLAAKADFSFSAFIVLSFFRVYARPAAGFFLGVVGVFTDFSFLLSSEPPVTDFFIINKF